MLEFDQSVVQGVVVISLKGRLDAITAPGLRPTIDEIVKKREVKVIFDLAELVMIDSSGMGAIVSLFKRLRVLGGDVKIARLCGQPKEIFRLLRLDRAFDIFDSLDDAVARFNRGARAHAR